MTTTVPRRIWRAVASFVAASPGTFILLFVVVVTTLVLRGADATTVDRILRQQSTNLVQMSRDAPRVLFLSAFVLDGGQIWRALVVFVLVLAPVERWIGSYRWVAVFAAGHVVATIVTTIAIGGRELSYVVDVGVSYGVAAVAGVLVYRLPRPASILAAAAFIAYAAVAIARTGTFTDWGHLSALLVGFGVGPLVRPVRPDAIAVARERLPVADRSWSGWWRWLSTPPLASRGWLDQRRHVARVFASALLASAAVLLVVTATVDTDVDVGSPRGITAATVVGLPERCGRACTSVAVRIGRSPSVTFARLDLPRATEAPSGTRVAVRGVPGRPGEVRLATVARRIDVRGLLAEIAVGSSVMGVVLMLTLGHAQRIVVQGAARPDDRVG
jgi:hypothetical protein